MIPLVSTVKEFKHQKRIVEKIAKKIQTKYKVPIKYKIGTMIELPRACLTAATLAKEADFFSFGTNAAINSA